MTPSPSQPEAVEIRKQITAYEASNEGLPTPMTPNEVQIIIDTGASISITNTKSDFITDITRVQPSTLKGIASGLSIEGIGSVAYTFKNDNGRYQEIILDNVLYVPKCSV
jgi:hypothetical protein